MTVFYNAEESGVMHNIKLGVGGALFMQEQEPLFAHNLVKVFFQKTSVKTFFETT